MKVLIILEILELLFRVFLGLATQLKRRKTEIDDWFLFQTKIKFDLKLPATYN